MKAEFYSIEDLPGKWDDLIKSVPEGSFFQTRAYSSFASRFKKAEPRFLMVSEGERPLVGLSYFRGNPSVRADAAFFFLNFLSKFSPSIHWSFGPTCFCSGQKRREALSLLFRALSEEEAGHWIKGGIGNPYARDYEYTESKKISSSAFSTPVFSVPENMDAAFSSFKKHLRKSIRKANLFGLTFEENNSRESVRAFYDIYSSRRRALGIGFAPFEEFSSALSDPVVSKFYRLFLVKRGKEVMAGQFSHVFNSRLYEMGMSISRSAIENKIPANDFLQWKLMNWAFEKGVREIDFAGLNLNDASRKGIDRFKLKWNPRVMHAPLWSTKTPLYYRLGRSFWRFFN